MIPRFWVARGLVQVDVFDNGDDGGSSHPGITIRHAGGLQSIGRPAVA
jgi:hypothetical protein